MNALSSEGHSITSILQAAAGRAWSRSLHTRGIAAAHRASSYDDAQSGEFASAGPS